MKNLFLAGILVFSLSAAQAQTKSKSSKKKSESAYAKINADSQDRLNSLRTDALEADSMRILEDSLAAVVLDSTRTAWKMNKTNEIDSINQVNFTNLAQTREKQRNMERNWQIIYKSAKLNPANWQQVSYLNSDFENKVTATNQDEMLAAEAKSAKLEELKKERKTKLNNLVGKSATKRLDKEQKKFNEKNPGVFTETETLVEIQ